MKHFFRFILLGLSIFSVSFMRSNAMPSYIATAQTSNEIGGMTSSLYKLEQSTLKNPIYCSPHGEDTSSGTANNPMSIRQAIKKVLPGQAILLQEGTYEFSEQLDIPSDNNGTSSAYKYMMPVKNATVTFDFSSEPYNLSDPSKNARGLQINGDYWHIYGIRIYKSADNGIYISGNHNIVEYCVLEANQDTGLQIGRQSSSIREFSNWPSNNLILNCTSFNNFDASTGENADGFAAKLTCGNGNVFDGCIAYNNVDDGWDLYTKTETGPIGPVSIRNSVAFRNGATSKGVFTANSDGNGFKLGGSSIAVSHIIENCLAFENKNHGFTDNSNPGNISLTNCSSINNSLDTGKKSNFDCARSESSHNTFQNLISFSEGNVASDKYKGTATNCSFQNSGKYYLITDTTLVDTKSSTGNKGTPNPIGITKDNFEHLNSPLLGENVHSTWRNLDGTLNIKYFAQTTADTSYHQLGAFLSHSKAATILPLTLTLNDDMPTSSPSPSPTLLGDINQDGSINIIDARLLKKHLLGLQINLDLQLGDLNEDGELNIMDMIVLKKIILYL